MRLLLYTWDKDNVELAVRRTEYHSVADGPKTYTGLDDGTKSSTVLDILCQIFYGVRGRYQNSYGVR